MMMEAPIKDQFIYCCEQNDYEVLENCLDRNFDVNQVILVGGQTTTGLELAYRLGNTAVVRRLLRVPGIDISSIHAELAR